MARGVFHFEGNIVVLFFFFGKGYNDVSKEYIVIKRSFVSIAAYFVSL